MAVVVLPEPPLGGRAEDDVATRLPHLVDENLQVVDIMIPCSVARTVLFLVVMAELAHHIIARAHHGEDFLQTVAPEEGAGGEPTLGMVGDGHPLVEPPRNHLAPAGPRLRILVYHRGVATAEDGGGRGVGLDADAAHRRSRTIELQGEAVVPVQVTLLTVFQTHRLLAGTFVGGHEEARRPLVDDEGAVDKLSAPGGDTLHHQAARLRPHHRLGLALLAP